MATSSSVTPISIINYKKPFNIDLGSITEYFCTVLASDGNHDRGALKNGNLLFKDHYVHSINIYKQYTKRTISAKCRAQMKKSTTYQLNLIINTNRPADILEGTCECVAGNGPRAACKHLAALCFALVDYDQNKLYEACTQRLQQWHQPTRKSSNPVPLLDIRFTCLHHNRSEENNLKYSQFLESYTYVPKASTTLNQLLIKYDQQSTAAAFFLLPRQDKNEFINLPARIIGAIPNSLDFILDPLILKYYEDHVHLSSIQISNLEKITRGQSSSDQWFEARKIRVSSTNVYDIVVQAKDFKKLAKSILDDRKKDLSFIPAVRHGILNEEVCRRRYVTAKAAGKLFFL